MSLELPPVRFMLFLIGLGTLSCAGLLWWRPVLRAGTLITDAIGWLRWQFAR